MVVVVVVVVIYLSVYRSIHLSIDLSIHPSIYLPFYLQAGKRSYPARRPQFLNLTTSKRSNSGRLPQFLHLTTSKTKQYCETASIFEFDDIKNEAIVRDFVQKLESWVQSWWPRTNAFCGFSTSPVWSTAPATKKWCQVIRSAAPVTQNRLSKPEDVMLQNGTSLRKSAPWPPNISDEHVSCTAPAKQNASLQILFKCHACHRFWNCYKTFTFYSLLARCRSPCACHAKPHPNFKTWSGTGSF